MSPTAGWPAVTGLRLAAKALDAEPLTLVRQGKSDYVTVLADKPTGIERTAAPVGRRGAGRIRTGE